MCHEGPGTEREGEVAGKDIGEEIQSRGKKTLLGEAALNLDPCEFKRACYKGLSRVYSSRSTGRG